MFPIQPTLSEEERRQELVIMKRRQGSLFLLGLCLLALRALPHPHEGVYSFAGETGQVIGGFREITLLRRGLALVAWLAVADYLGKPLFVRWRWRKWYPLG